MTPRKTIIALALVAGAVALAACATDDYTGAAAPASAAPAGPPDNSGQNAGGSTGLPSAGTRDSADPGSTPAPPAGR